MNGWLVMIGLILLMLGFATTLIMGVMFVFGGLTVGELKERLVIAALRTYTLEGEPIPNAVPGRFAQLILWLAYRGGHPPPVVVDEAQQDSADQARRVRRQAPRQA